MHNKQYDTVHITNLPGGGGGHAPFAPIILFHKIPEYFLGGHFHENEYLRSTKMSSEAAQT